MDILLTVKLSEGGERPHVTAGIWAESGPAVSNYVVKKKEIEDEGDEPLSCT